MTGALATLAHCGQSFRLAGRWLPASILADAAELHAFCRGADGLADESADPRAAPGDLLQLRNAVMGSDDTRPLAARSPALRREHGLDPGVAAAWLPTGLDPARLNEAPDHVFSAVRKLLERADQRYRGAEPGYCHLPARIRPAIRAAARIGEEIGLRLLKHGPAHLRAGRCVVPMPRKLFLLAGSLIATPTRSALGPVRRDARA